MIFIVRRTLQTGRTDSQISRQIFHEYRRLCALGGADWGDPPRLYEQVAHRICDQMIKGMEKKARAGNEWARVWDDSREPQRVAETLVA
jgi:hypothetical protein